VGVLGLHGPFLARQVTKAFGEREGAAVSLRSALMTTASRYEKGVDFCIAALEDGKEYDDLPIFAAREGVLQWQSPSEPPKMREIPGAEDTAFVIENVLSKPECEQIIALTEAMGYHQDAPVNLGRDIRQNENCVWVTEDEITHTIFQRCAHLLPQRFELPRRDGTGMQIGPIAGLNARWRLYKYSPGDIFRRHHDGSWTPSAIIDGPDGVQASPHTRAAPRPSLSSTIRWISLRALCAARARSSTTSKAPRASAS